MPMKGGTRIEARSVSESVAAGRITFVMQQRVVITDMLNLYVDGESQLTMAVRAFDAAVAEDFGGDRQAAIDHMCDRSPNWVPIWYQASRGIGDSPPLAYGQRP